MTTTNTLMMPTMDENVQDALRFAINDSLSLHIYANAIFLAERLHSNAPSEGNLLLLVQCYMQSGDIDTTYRLLRSYYPFALSADVTTKETLKLRWRLQYTLAVTCGMRKEWSECQQALSALYTSDDAVAESGVLYWRAQCQMHMERNAAASLADAVEANPCLFTVYDTLLRNYLGASSGLEALAAATHGTSQPRLNPDIYLGADDEEEAAQATGNVTEWSSTMPGNLVPATCTSSYIAPIVSDTSSMAIVRRFLRPYATMIWSHHNYNLVGVFNAQCNFNIAEQASGWTLGTIGMALSHCARRHEALEYFKRMREVDPWKLNEEAIIAMSTTLWHLGDEGGLGVMSNDLYGELRGNSVACTVAGNYYSIMHDQRSALNVLSKAVELDPSLAVAHTLRGMEYLSLDQKNEAEVCFFSALKVAPRHFLAFAGLAEVAQRQGSQTTAQHYYKLAADINPNPMILHRLGSTFVRRDNPDSLRIALSLYARALQLDPHNIQCLHQRAAVHHYLNENEEALTQLDLIRAYDGSIGATEVMRGKVLLALGNTRAAAEVLHRAIEMDPKQMPAAKQLLERAAAAADSAPG